MAYSASLTKLDGTTISVDRLFSTSLNLNHTALHTAEIETFASTAGTGEAFADIDIDLDGSALFRGEIVEPQEDQPTEGYSTLRAVGPGYELTREAPGSEISYSNTRVYDAVDDYWNNQVNGVNVSATVSEPTPNILENDQQIENIPTNTAFSTEFSIASDVPAQFNNSEIQLQQHAFPNITSNFTGTFTTNTDSSSDSYFHINGEYATLTSSGDNVNGDAPVNHDIPANRVGVVIHYYAINATTTVSDANLTFNGVNLGFQYQVDKDPVSGNMKYAVFNSGEYANNGGGDLSAGTSYNVGFSIDTSADIEVDYLYVYDTKYPPANYDEPSSFGGKISGPSFYPGDVELTSVRHFEQGNVQEARLETTWSETTNDQRLSLSNTDGDSYINGNNQSNLTADFDGNSTYGTTVRSKVRLSGTSNGNGVWVSNNASGQDLEDYKLYVTVDDIQIIDNVTVRDNHFKNLQELHRGEWRWVIDPAVRDPVTVEAFREGRNGSSKSVDWRTISATQTRDVRDYANQILFIYNDSSTGNRDSITVRRQSEVNAKSSTVLQAVEETTTQFTDREAHNEATNRLNDRIAIDETTGSIEAWADSDILPGYEYTVDEWGIDGSINRVRYSESADGATMTLQFVADRDVTQQVIQNI